MADYIPAGDEAFLDWARTLYNYALAHFADWGGIPTPATSLGALLGNYLTAFTTAQKPNRGRVDVLAKNQARDALKKAVRVYVKAWLINNPLVTDEDRLAMGLPVHKTTKTPVVPPRTAPVLDIDTRTRRRLIIDYRDEASTRRAKPKNVHGIEIRWAILDHPPASILELIRSSFDTDPPLVLDFDESDRGKRVYLCGHWEIGREGGEGPDGAIVEVIIP
ncbi:MAG: hypothetical protein LBQ55_03060 [Treponema sp.]|jgi:hypothetical protein|nr:hypothetical protein [Treponema sp.]